MFGLKAGPAQVLALLRYLGPLQTFQLALFVLGRGPRQAAILRTFRFKDVNEAIRISSHLIFLAESGWSLAREGHNRIAVSFGTTSYELSESNIHQLDAFRLMLSERGWNVQSETVSKGPIRIYHGGLFQGVFEAFETCTYMPDFDLDGKTVVDVGASIGDTPVAFAKRGATVHAFEPNAQAFELCARNIRTNGVDRQVRLLPYAIGEVAAISFPSDGLSAADAYGAPNVPTVVSPGGSTESHEEGESPKRPRAARLADVLNDVSRPYLLKLDCEGAEYSIVSHDYESVKKFPFLMMEWHSGASGQPVDELVRALKGHFECFVLYGVPPGLTRARQRAFVRQIGMLYACRHDARHTAAGESFVRYAESFI